LESEKTRLLQQEEKLKVELAEVEKQLLEELATSTGNILENKGLIESLNNTKSKSITIETSLAQSHELQASLDEQREVYRKVANLGSIIFMLIQEIKNVNHMYQFSLSSFLKLFNHALTNQVETADL
jgi:dynein heavy chain 2